MAESVQYKQILPIIKNWTYSNLIVNFTDSNDALVPSPSNPSSSGLSAYWAMDEASWNGTPGEVADSSGNGNNGTAVSGATTTTGKINNGGTFDGTNYADSNYSVDYGTTSFTWSAWIKTTTSSDTYIIGSIEEAGSIDPGVLLEVNYTGSANKLRTFIRNSAGSTGVEAIGTTDVNDGSWHHVLLTREVSGTDNFGLYVDGVQEDTASMTSGNINFAGTDVFIGALNNRGSAAGYFPGQINKMKIFITVFKT